MSGIPYAPSPRPTFTAPAKIAAGDATRHIWGDAEAGEVADWIYVSSQQIHTIVFGLAPGGVFRHSTEYRTVFGADEVLTVLEGTMILANPERGEVHRVDTGASIAFGPDTWHHAFAHGPEPLRVLEFFAPPPATGSSGPYARTRPYLETPNYADDSVLGRWPSAGRAGDSMHPIAAADVHHRLVGNVLVGLLWSTERLTATTISAPPGADSGPQRRGGDEVLYMREGRLHVRAWYDGAASVFELGPDDACYLPEGSTFEYRNYTASNASALAAVAPSFAPRPA